jgi:hypothetical protein
VSKLFEQIYNTTRLYFHGAKPENKIESLHNEKIFYVTPIESYAENYYPSFGKMYLCRLLRSNIFNAQSKTDKEKLRKRLLDKCNRLEENNVITYFREQLETFPENYGWDSWPEDSTNKKVVEELLYHLQDKDWLNVLDKSRRKNLFDIIQELGYDGFMNYEHYHISEEGKGDAAVGLFHPKDSVKILKVCSKKQLTQYKQRQLI